MLGALGWVGARARYVLILGCLAAFFFPAAAETLRPALPALVAMVYAVSMTRIDLAAVTRAALRPRRAAGMVAASALLLLATPALGFAAVRLLGLGESYEAAVVWAFAAPPIASAASLCFMLGLNGALALELTVASSVLAPIFGPLAAWALLGEAAPISPGELGLRTAAMLGAGAAAAILLRRLIGAERIARSGVAFDGIAAIAMLFFVIPLFDGVGDTVRERPGLALAMLGFSCVLILLPHLVLRLAERERADAGAAAVVWGTRSVAIYLAALPPDPVFTLFVAVYQFPMYATPLLLRRFYGD